MLSLCTLLPHLPMAVWGIGTGSDGVICGWFFAAQNELVRRRQ
jgi:hypothetical protein